MEERHVAVPSDAPRLPRILLTVAALVCLLLVFGCSGSGSPGGPSDDDDQPGDRIYVDASYAGVEEGTQEHPFNTIEEGIAAASRGDIVVLAAGTYSRPGHIGVPRAITIHGAGADSTIVSSSFRVSAPSGTTAVRVKNLACESVAFEGDVGCRTEGRVEYAPVALDSCDVRVVWLSWPSEHSYTIENSVIDSVKFAHGETAGAVHVVRNCQIAGSVRFAHGGGPTSNTIEDCVIGGAIYMQSGEGPTYLITGNTVNGIFDSSGGAYTTISYNTLPSGDLMDYSGGFGGEDEEEFIEHNVVQNGVADLACWNVTFRWNTVHAPAGAIAVTASSGSPTYIVGNTITLPYEEAAGEPWEWTSIGVRAYCGLGTIEDNIITGGSAGILDVSASAEISGNTITGSCYGIYSRHSNGKRFVGNTISDCVSDGILVTSTNMSSEQASFEGNAVSGNGGAGVRLLRTADLGGGAQGSAGGNVLTGNADYDLYIEVPADSAAVIYAEGNTWDHVTEGEIDADDIYDANDDVSLSDVDFMPLGGGGGAW